MGVAGGLPFSTAANECAEFQWPWVKVLILNGCIIYNSVQDQCPESTLLVFC